MKAAAALLVLSALSLAGCGGSGSGGGPALRFVALDDAAHGEVPTDLTGNGATTIGYFSTGSSTTACVVWKGSSPTSQSFPISYSGAAFLSAVTPDGAHILGIVDPLLGRPALFTPTGETTILPLIDGKDSGYPVDLSDDGSVILCLDAPPSAPYHPRPYLVKDGHADYLPLPFGVTTAEVSAISGDGRVVVGAIGNQAAIWVDGGVPQLIAAPESYAKDVNRDGSVVVGVQRGDVTVSSHAFRWTATGGADFLPTDPAYPNGGFAYGVSADGNTVLLSSDGAGVQFVPQLWRKGRGTQTAAARVTAAGGDGASFDGFMPIRLSANGHTILGRAKTGGLARPWKLTLP